MDHDDPDLIDYLERVGFSARQAANVLRVSIQAVYSWAARERHPRREKKLLLVGMLGIRMEALERLLCPYRRSGRPRKRPRGPRGPLDPKRPRAPVPDDAGPAT